MATNCATCGVEMASGNYSRHCSACLEKHRRAVTPSPELAARIERALELVKPCSGVPDSLAAKVRALLEGR